MSQGNRFYEKLLGFILLFFSLFSATSILLYLYGGEAFLVLVFAVPGEFLERSLKAAAWFVPAYFLILAIWSLLPRQFDWRNTVFLNALIVPVLSIAAFLRLYESGGRDEALLLQWLVESFTLRGSLLILSLLLALESFGLLQLVRMLWSAPSENGGRSRGAIQALPAPTARVGSTAEEQRHSRTGDSDSLEPDSPEPFAELNAADAPEADDLDEDVDENELDPDHHKASYSLEELKQRFAVPDAAETEDDHAEQDDAIGEATEAESQDQPIRLNLRRPPINESAEPRWDEEEGLEPKVAVDDGFGVGSARDPFYEDETAVDDPVPFDDEGLLDDDDPFEVDAEDIEDPFDEDTEVPEDPPRGSHNKYNIPRDGVLEEYADGRYWEIDDTTQHAAETLRVTLEEFGIQAEVTGIRKGPVITMFEILPAPGVKLAKITNLSDNIALRLAASSVRIVAPIPGKHAVGIEIPNRQRHLVGFGELLEAEEFESEDLAIPIALGKDIAGEAQIVDLTKTPHLLIAGATGSGKSVCVNSIIGSILYRRAPTEVKLILIDPKIVELKFYNDIPHLLTPVITDPKRAFQALQYLLYEMERRYSLLDSLGVRDIVGYNNKIRRRHLATEPLPYLVVIIDEFADLMATSGKELESTVARLAAMSRAVGIHLVLATQRPSTDVITGLIKANIPSRIAFMVASKVDSRIIIDAVGAEKLLGRGDMLFTSAWEPFPVRMQGAFLSEDEVERIAERVKEYGEPDYIDDEIFFDEEEDEYDDGYLEDPLMEKAIEVVVGARKASASYLQRRLKVGYNRAARMVEEMERRGIVGPQNGSKPREVMSNGTYPSS